MIFNTVMMNRIKECVTIEVSQDELSRMSSESGASTNAVMCRLAVSKLLEKFPAKEKFTLLEVADLRGRACEVDFGTGMPLRAQQAMLPDMIKFCQSEPGGPVQIIFSGFAARTLSQAR